MEALKTKDGLYVLFDEDMGEAYAVHQASGQPLAMSGGGGGGGGGGGN